MSRHADLVDMSAIMVIMRDDPDDEKIAEVIDILLNKSERYYDTLNELIDEDEESKYSYPEWLQIGQTVTWAYKNINGRKVVSKSEVTAHEKGRVYMVGSCYGFHVTPEDIMQVFDKEEGEWLDE